MRWITLAALLTAGCNGTQDDDITDSGTVEDTDGFPYHSRQDQMIDGCTIQLSTQTFLYDQGEAKGTIVMSQGRTEYTDMYHHVVQMMGDKPYNVVLWDTYGQGRSEGTRAHWNDVQQEGVCDLEQVIAQLVPDEKPYAHLCHSTGCLMTTLWLEQHPGESLGALMSSPLLRLGRPGLTQDQICGQASIGVMAGQSEVPTGNYVRPDDCLESYSTHDCDMYEQWYQDPITEIGDSTWGWVDSVCTGIGSVWDNVDQLQEPIYIQQAEEDTTVDATAHPEFCTALADAGNPSCEVYQWPGTWHELHKETIRQEWMDANMVFLDGLFE